MTPLYDLFAESAARHPGKIALRSEDTVITYAGLMHLVAEKVEKLPKKLRAVTMPVATDVESITALLACAKRNICVMPLSPATERQEQERLTERVFGGQTTDEDQPFLLLNTSGTTGDPKLIALSQQTKVLRTYQFANLYDITPDDVILVGTPLHFSMAQRLVFTTLLRGASARLLKGYSPDRWAEEAQQCSVVVGLPHQLPYLEGRNAPRLRLVLNTSAPRNDYNESRYRDCWGTSEIAIATSLCPLMALHDDMGTTALGVDLRIEPSGEIAVKTPTIFSGYYKRPDLTAAAMTEDGYFLTGDAGFLDDRGSLHLLGRINDVIKVGGVKVWPEEVEAAVLAMPGVADCAAIGVPDGKLGERVHVVIVPAVATNPPTLREIQHHCTDRLLGPSLPRSLAFVTELPRTANGKLLRRALK